MAQAEGVAHEGGRSFAELDEFEVDGWMNEDAVGLVDVVYQLGLERSEDEATEARRTKWKGVRSIVTSPFSSLE